MILSELPCASCPIGRPLRLVKSPITLPMYSSGVVTSTFIIGSNKTALHDVKYFEEGGFQFKLENGKVYKKKWINISSSESSDEYRIINSVTKKPIKSDKYEIEKLDWVEL